MGYNTSPIVLEDMERDRQHILELKAEVERLKEAANRAAGIIVTMPTRNDPAIIDAIQRAVAALRGEEGE